MEDYYLQKRLRECGEIFRHTEADSFLIDKFREDALPIRIEGQFLLEYMGKKKKGSYLKRETGQRK